MSKEELIEHLSAIASQHAPGAKVVDIDITPIERSTLGRKQGNKTLTYKLFVHDYEGHPSGIPQSINLPFIFILKKDKDGSHFNLRRAVLSVCNEFIKPYRYESFFGATTFAFPFSFSVGYVPFNEKRLTLSVAISEKALDEKVEEYTKESGKLDDIEILKPANNPKIVVNEKLPLYEEEIKRRLRGKIKELSLEELTKIYMNSLAILSGKSFKEKLSKEVEEVFKNSAREHFFGKEENSLITLDEFDGYPWHNLYVCLVDPGSMKKISRGIGLACQWCFPTVFNYFKKPEIAIKILTEDYVEKRKNFLEEISVKNKPEIDSGQLERDIYFGGIFINTRYSSQIKNNGEEEFKSYLNSIRKLLDIYEGINSKTAKN